jgi:hypothetical protein
VGLFSFIGKAVHAITGVVEGLHIPVVSQIAGIAGKVESALHIGGGLSVLKAYQPETTSMMGMASNVLPGGAVAPGTGSAPGGVAHHARAGGKHHRVHHPFGFGLHLHPMAHPLHVSFGRGHTLAGRSGRRRRRR